MNFRVSFWWGVSIEAGLLLVAAGLAWVWAVPWWGTWHWSWLDFGWGVAGAAPMLFAFWRLMRLEWPALRRIREFLERVLGSALGGWSVAQMLAISVLAGVAEELFFRAVLQGGLERGVGAVPALVLAGVVFGICHWITPAYALIAGLMGCYLGGLWWWSGNLLTPVVAHAVYDFVALVWLLRIRREGANRGCRLPLGLFTAGRTSSLPRIARTPDSSYSMPGSDCTAGTVPVADGLKPACASVSCAVVVVDSESGSGEKVAGLSVLDRLVISLSRAGFGRIVLVGEAPGGLPRATELGVRVEVVDSMPALVGPRLLTEGNVFVSVADLGRVRRGSGRLVSPEGRRLLLGVVNSADGDWRVRLDRVPAVMARRPAGVVTDGASAGAMERAYWTSLTSSSDGWVDRRFNRPVGRWLSLALVGTPVTPNQVSVVAIGLGLAAAGFLAVGSYWAAVWGAMVLQLSAMVDCVDGDLARAQCRESVLGKWLDIVGDQIVHVGVFLGLGIGLWRLGQGNEVLVLGMVAAVGVVMSFLVILRVLLQPELRGHGRIQRLIDATTNRDFSVLLIVFALGGVLHWFMWLAAVGSHLFWVVALAVQIQDRER